MESNVKNKIELTKKKKILNRKIWRAPCVEAGWNTLLKVYLLVLLSASFRSRLFVSNATTGPKFSPGVKGLTLQKTRMFPAMPWRN